MIWRFFTHGIHDESFDFHRFRFTAADADSVRAFQKVLKFPPNHNVKLFTAVIWQSFNHGIHDESFDFPRFEFTAADTDSARAFQKTLKFSAKSQD